MAASSCKGLTEQYMAILRRATTRVFSVVLLILSGYQLLLVAGRWFAAIKYRLHFADDSGAWISLGVEALIFGFASLLLVGVMSLWLRQRARTAEDVLCRRISTTAFALTVISTVALVVLVLLPTTSVLKR